MKDTLNTVAGMAGIPDAAIRVTILIGVLLILSVTIILLYFKMKEVDTPAR